MRRTDDLVKLAEHLKGLAVLGCRQGSPASKAGVRYGDILLSVNGKQTPDWPSYVEAMNQSASDPCIVVFRDGSEVTLRLELSAPRQPVDAQALLSEVLETVRAPSIPPAPDEPS